MLVQMLEWVKAHTGAEQIEVDGRSFVRLGYEAKHPPAAGPLEFGTLTGLADFAGMTFKTEPVLFINVRGPREVHLHGPLDETYRSREMFGQAVPTVGATERFQLGHPLSQENFITQAQAFFVDDELTDKAGLLRIVGNLRASDVQTLEDDGVTQQVATARGVAMKEMAVMPNPVKLREFITFPEVAQPLGEYIVRVRCGAEDEHTTISLKKMPDPTFDADCVNEIVTWLRNELPDIPVLG